jgi:hypothetical protein
VSRASSSCRLYSRIGTTRSQARERGSIPVRHAGGHKHREL